MLSAEEPADSMVEGNQLSRTIQARFAGSLFLFCFGFVATLTLFVIRLLSRPYEQTTEPVKRQNLKSTLLSRKQISEEPVPLAVFSFNRTQVQPK